MNIFEDMCFAVVWVFAKLSFAARHAFLRAKLEVCRTRLENPSGPYLCTGVPGWASTIPLWQPHPIRFNTYQVLAIARPYKKQR